jgi:hypothetical protein
MTMEEIQNTHTYFEPNYGFARHRFLKAASERGGELVSFEIAAKGPDGQDLSIDIAWFGSPKPERVFVHSSGAHGVEMFAGSAIQQQWLKDGLPAIPSGGAIAIVHGLNPYGAAWLRRFNENNVDLNRNFREADEFTPDAIPHWERIDPFLNPPTPPDHDWFHIRAVALALRYGARPLKQSIAGGQCLNPKGLFFGGSSIEEGPSKFRKFVQQRLADAKRIVAIDVHTGLGRFGEDRLLVDERRGYTKFSPAMSNAFGDRLELLNPGGIAYCPKGAHHEMYYRSFPDAEVCFASQEFGTYNSWRVLAALRAENRAHHYGARPGVREELVEVFNPSSEEWRRAVLTRGKEVIEQALRLTFEDRDRRAERRSTAPARDRR